MVIIDSTSADDPNNQFNLSVYQDNPDPDEEPFELEVFENLSMDPASPDYVKTVINSRSNYLSVSVNVANSNQIAGYSESGEITLVGNLLGPNQNKFRINLHGDGFRTVDLTTALSGADLSSLEDIRAAIESTIQSLTPLKESTPSAAYNVSVTIVNTNKLRITSGHASADSKVEVIKAEKPLEDAAGALKLGRGNGGTEVFGSSEMRPQDTSTADFYFLGDDTVAGAVSNVVPGDNGTLPLQDTDYIAALNWLDTIRDASIISIPGIGSEAVADAGMNYCRNRPLSDCFFIADMAEDDLDLDDALEFRNNINTTQLLRSGIFPLAQNFGSHRSIFRANSSPAFGVCRRDVRAN